MSILLASASYTSSAVQGVQRLVEAQTEVSPEEVRKVKMDVSWLSEDTALIRDVLQEVLEQGGPLAPDVVTMTFLWKDRHPFDEENLARSHVFMTWSTG